MRSIVLLFCVVISACVYDEGLSCNEGELIIDNQSREHKVVAGGLQLCFGGSFINICHTFNSNEIWKENEASVACRQLGYGGNDSTKLIPNVSNNYTLLLTCFGHEDSLDECFIVIDEVTQCTLDAGVACLTEIGTCQHGALQHSDDSVLQYCDTGKWLNICTDFWTTVNAIISCRQLGFFIEGGQLNFVPVMPSSLMSNIHFYCFGDENELKDCSKALLQPNYTCHTSASVSCLQDGLFLEAVNSNTLKISWIISSDPPNQIDIECSDDKDNTITHTVTEGLDVDNPNAILTGFQSGTEYNCCIQLTIEGVIFTEYLCDNITLPQQETSTTNSPLLNTSTTTSSLSKTSTSTSSSSKTSTSTSSLSKTSTSTSETTTALPLETIQADRQQSVISDNQSLGVGIAIGFVVGVVLMLILCIIVTRIVLIRQRKNKKNKRESMIMDNPIYLNKQQLQVIGGNRSRTEKNNQKEMHSHQANKPKRYVHKRPMDSSGTESSLQSSQSFHEPSEYMVPISTLNATRHGSTIDAIEYDYSSVVKKQRSHDDNSDHNSVDKQIIYDSTTYNSDIYDSNSQDVYSYAKTDFISINIDGTSKTSTKPKPPKKPFGTSHGRKQHISRPNVSQTSGIVDVTSPNSSSIRGEIYTSLVESDDLPHSYSKLVPSQLNSHSNGGDATNVSRSAVSDRRKKPTTSPNTNEESSNTQTQPMNETSDPDRLYFVLEQTKPEDQQEVENSTNSDRLYFQLERPQNDKEAQSKVNDKT